MNLYIETINEQPVNHPAFEDNLIQTFGIIPENWEPFIRVKRPIPNVYQVLESDEPVYTKVDGVWTDMWTIRDMSAEEKSAKQQKVFDDFNAREQISNWSAWKFDEDTCTMVPPIPRPERIEGVLMFWCGADNVWKEAPERPVDDKRYKFDFFAWQWTQIVN